MRQEKNTKAMFNRHYWLGLSLASAATLAAALISTGTVRAENKSIPDWVSRREVGIYDPSVPDIEDDPTIFDDPGPIKVPEAPKRDLPSSIDEESFFTRVNTMHLILIDLYTKFGMIQENKFRRI